MPRLFLPPILLALTASSLTLPVAVVNTQGKVMQGSATASLLGGTFEVADGEAICFGTYEMSLPATLPITCTDGRRGTVTFTRGVSVMSGSGYVELSDKSHAAFFFGRAAEEVLSSKETVL